MQKLKSRYTNDSKVPRECQLNQSSDGILSNRVSGQELKRGTIVKRLLAENEFLRAENKRLLATPCRDSKPKDESQRSVRQRSEAAQEVTPRGSVSAMLTPMLVEDDVGIISSEENEEDNQGDADEKRSESIRDEQAPPLSSCDEADDKSDVDEKKAESIRDEQSPPLSPCHVKDTIDSDLGAKISDLVAKAAGRIADSDLKASPDSRGAEEVGSDIEEESQPQQGSKLMPRPPLLPPPQSVLPPWKRSTGTLTLMTFGLNDPSGPNGDRGLKNPRSPKELQRALEQRGEPVDIILDAIHFPDPNTMHLRDHIGVHPEIISRIVRHDEFGDYMKYVKANWKSVLRRKHAESHSPAHRHPDMAIAVYCKSGKHRSVAICECLKYIGTNVEGLHFAGPMKHLSQSRWWGCKGECRECTAHSVEKEDALRQAAEVWQQCGGVGR